jgi:hypothetical protein
MAYTNDQLKQIVQWIAQRVPRFTEQGCPLCGAPMTAFGVQQIALPGLEVPLLAVACRTCGHVMLFNEKLVLGDSR